jgi:hypothetical protein
VNPFGTRLHDIAPSSKGLGPRSNYALGVVCRLLVFLLQRDGGEHRGSCEARRPAAAAACVPEHERNGSGDKRERSDDAADDRWDFLRAVRVRGKLR